MGVGEARVAAIDDGVARLQRLHQAALPEEHLVDRRACGHHEPYRARRLERSDERCERLGRLKPVHRHRFSHLVRAVETDDAPRVAEEVSRKPDPHLPEPDNADLAMRAPEPVRALAGA